MVRVCGVAWVYQMQYHTHTHATRSVGTAGLPIPVWNPIWLRLGHTHTPCGLLFSMSWLYRGWPLLFISWPRSSWVISKCQERGDWWIWGHCWDQCHTIPSSWELPYSVYCNLSFNIMDWMPTYGGEECYGMHKVVLSGWYRNTGFNQEASLGKVSEFNRSTNQQIQVWHLMVVTCSSGKKKRLKKKIKVHIIIQTRIRQT